MKAQTPPIRDISSYEDDQESNVCTMKNMSIPVRASSLPVRANIYIPLEHHSFRVPVLVTYGPYGKDIPYATFHENSFAEVNPEHRSGYSAWETPDPVFWTQHGYAVVRVDEQGTGQSPGFLDSMSQTTSECFFDVIEWCAEQPWSTGKVGLLGISYYAGSQWRVAARRPKGLAAIVPWEGMSDYYRDRCRHGGILSNTFINYWWNHQVLPNQYGKAERSALQFPAGWAGIRGQEETIEGNLPDDVLAQNRRDQTIDNSQHRFRDEEYYASKDYRLEDIEVPILSVANWGGISLHLRGNVEGYMHAGSKLKYLRFITGRHDLPFYYHDEVLVQKSFLDAFLKGKDNLGWSVPGRLPPVSMRLRNGDVGVNNPEGENAYVKRMERAWPIPRTQYTKYYLNPEMGLDTHPKKIMGPARCSYQALGSVQDPHAVQFTTPPFEEETEITGHIVAHLNVSMTGGKDESFPDKKDMDVFLTLRHLNADDKEIFYTGTVGDPVPLCKGWLRVSLRKTRDDDPLHRPWLPRREYLSTDVQAVEPGKIYGVDVEVWPTNVIVQPGQKIVLEIASGDTQGCGIFRHDSPIDRQVLSQCKFSGWNHVHFDEGLENYVTLPIILPQKEEDISPVEVDLDTNEEAINDN
ncbi:X-Pro dipeptidyl-peptidase C-terminal non-catalytic domain-containing protein [Astrocystis sublimbata]|nr:X-Pro dipeptidyl-peptidase C-terminal non-catalytic domain-containing protein [Astrocystis sublimbata]